MEVPAHCCQFSFLIICIAFTVYVNSRDLQDGESKEDVAHKLQQLHVAHDAKAKTCNRLFLNYRVHLKKIDAAKSCIGDHHFCISTVSFKSNVCLQGLLFHHCVKIKSSFVRFRHRIGLL